MGKRKNPQQKNSSELSDYTYTPADCILSKDVKYANIMLHPGHFNGAFPYMIAVTKDNKITVKKFELVEGYSTSLKLDE